MRRTILGLTIFLALATGAATAHAVVHPEQASADGSITPRLASRVRLDGPGALEKSPAWRSFRARHGRWSAMWNEATRSPHRALGEGIALPGFADDKASVDRAVRGFIASNPDLFGPNPDLAVSDIRRVRSIWYVRYDQLAGGRPIMFADWEFRVGRNGKLFAFGADAYRPPASPVMSAMIPGAVARAAARAGLDFDPATDRVTGGEILVAVPIQGARGPEFRDAYMVDVYTQDPPGAWTTLVDAATGDVLYRRDRVRQVIDGHVTGMIHPLHPTDPLEAGPLAHLDVVVGGDTVVTDATGAYAHAGGGTVSVTAALNGPYSRVFRQDGGSSGSFSTTAMDPSTVDIAWSSANSHDAERDAFYHVNVAHDYIKALDPTFTGLDYRMPTAVNILATCNAFWNGLGVNFFVAGNGCVNTATLPDVVYHEYGHGVNDKLYESLGELPIGMGNAAIHEGMADVLAAFMLDDPVIGDGFYGAGTSIRNVDNTNRWPEDASGDSHLTGQILAGAFWDLRQSIGLPLASELSHFCKYGRPDDVDDGVAMSEFFIETLVADDDDADLSNGTPHSDEIVAAFNAHGIGSDFFLSIDHTALGDAASGVQQVVADITYDGPIGQLDATSPTLHYSIDGGPYQTRPMQATGAPDQFAALLPMPVTSIVRYYISAADVFGGSLTDPFGAPDPRVHVVVAGPQTTVLDHDMESDQGWTVGDVDDDATTGIWERVQPVGTQVGGAEVQPSFAHSYPTCFVTENGVADGLPGDADVDGGKTTLFSPVFDAVGPGLSKPMVEYYRWYSNNAGSTPGTDTWQVDISNDAGASWTPVESTMQTLNEWSRIVFPIADFVTPTSSMQLRFIASDEGQGSLVEAALDDFRLFGFSETVAVGPTPDARMELAPPSPNPFRGEVAVAFTLPAAGPASVAVYDIGGRKVRTLAGGAQAAGPHRLTWDGRDDGGLRLPSGVYFVRLRRGADERTRTVQLVR